MDSAVGDVVSLAELARIAQSPQLAKSYIFVSGKISARDLGINGFDEYHFFDSNGSPVTVLIRGEALGPNQVEEYEFFQLLENGTGPEFNNGQFYNTSSNLEPVTDVVQSKLVYFQVGDLPTLDVEHSTKPFQDRYYPLVSNPMTVSPTLPSHN